MNCLECATRFQRETTAVSTCAQCGAASCVEHTSVGKATVAEHSPGIPSSLPLPGRRLFCPVCAPENAESLR